MRTKPIKPETHLVAASVPTPNEFNLIQAKGHSATVMTLMFWVGLVLVLWRAFR